MLSARQTPPLPTRRRLLTSAAAAVANACGRHKGTGFPGYALIAVVGERAVAVVDLTRFRHLKDIGLNAEPRALFAAPNGSIYALTPQNGTLHCINSDLQLNRSFRWAQTLASASLSSNGQRLAAIAGGSRELLVAETQTMRLQRRYQLGAEPRYLATGVHDYAAISAFASGLIELVHLGSGQRWHRQMPGEVGKLVFRDDGQLLLAANLHGRSLIALSVPALEIVAELPLAMRPDHLCFGADGGQLFISGEGMDGVAIVFPYRILQVDQTVLAGRDPGVMAASGSPAYLFVASASGSDVCIMDIDNRRVIGLVDVAERPGFIAITPDNQYALVLNEAAGDMAVIHIAAIHQDFLARRGKTGASLFTMLPVGDRPVHAIVVRQPV